MNTTPNRTSRTSVTSRSRNLARLLVVAVSIPVAFQAAGAAPAGAESKPFGPDLDISLPPLDPCWLHDCDGPVITLPPLDPCLLVDCDGPVIGIPEHDPCLVIDCDDDPVIGIPDPEDDPDVPETPDTPDTPDEPETPDTPDEPETPDTPDPRPEDPDQPGYPETPGEGPEVLGRTEVDRPVMATPTFTG